MADSNQPMSGQVVHKKVIKNKCFEFRSIPFRHGSEAGQQQCRRAFLVQKTITQDFSGEVQDPGRGEGKRAEIDVETVRCLLVWKQALGSGAKGMIASQEQGHDVPSKYVSWLIAELVSEVA